MIFREPYFKHELISLTGTNSRFRVKVGIGDYAIELSGLSKLQTLGHEFELAWFCSINLDICVYTDQCQFWCPNPMQLEEVDRRGIGFHIIHIHTAIDKYSSDDGLQLLMLTPGAANNNTVFSEVTLWKYKHFY